jgi:hypothetical protein
MVLFQKKLWHFFALNAALFKKIRADAQAPWQQAIRPNQMRLERMRWSHTLNGMDWSG